MIVLGAKTTFFVCFALSLIWADINWSSFHRFRQHLVPIVLPVQQLVNGPIRAVHWMGEQLFKKASLKEENTRLRARELLLRSKLQELKLLKAENHQLKQLLQSSAKVTGKVKIAEIYAMQFRDHPSRVRIDKGALEQVYLGQPVLDAYGVMGQIISVSPYTSVMMFLTDARSAIPVKSVRNGYRSIAVGTNTTGELALLHVIDRADIKVGDEFVTSGLGEVFPVGYPVGKVLSVRKAPGERFKTVTLFPASHLDQTDQVLLVWPLRRQQHAR